MIVEASARERNAVSGAGRSHLHAAVTEGEQERNPKMMIFSSDAEQMRAQGMILLAAFGGRKRVGSRWSANVRLGGHPARSAARTKRSM
jgi:hypothetical protein